MGGTGCKLLARIWGKRSREESFLAENYSQPFECVPIQYRHPSFVSKQENVHRA